MIKVKKILPLLLISILCTGCWDKVEIDRKIFISTIAIDLGVDADDKNALKGIKPEDPFQQRVQTKKLSVTYAFPDITELGPGKPGTAKNQFIHIDASSMEDATLEATGKSSRTLEFGQSRLVILSSDLLKKPEIFKEILDYLARNATLNKMMEVIVTDGSAQDLIKFQPPMEKNVEAYLSGLMEASKKNSSILPVTLNELLVLLNNNGEAILPKVSVEKDKNELSLSGLGILKNYELKGYLTPIEVSDLELLRGRLKGGNRVIYMDGHSVDFSIEDMQRKIKLISESNGKLQFNINIRIEGQIKEYYQGKDIFSKETLNQMQQNFDKSIENECKIIMKLLQQEYSVDPIDLREYVEKYNPALWKRVGSKWEESYKEAIINVNVDTKIRRVGVIR